MSLTVLPARSLVTGLGSRRGQAPTTSTTLPDGATSYTATGLSNGTAYQFAVEAVNRSGAGPATPWASVTPSLSSPPLAPSNLTAHLNASGPDYLGLYQVTLSWSAPLAGACPGTSHIQCTLRGYELGYDYSVTSFGTPQHTKVAIGAGATTATTQSLLLNLTEDEFTLDAENGYGTGPELRWKYCSRWRRRRRR